FHVTGVQTCALPIWVGTKGHVSTGITKTVASLVRMILIVYRNRRQHAIHVDNGVGIQSIHPIVTQHNILPDMQLDVFAKISCSRYIRPHGEPLAIGSDGGSCIVLIVPGEKVTILLSTS